MEKDLQTKIAELINEHGLEAVQDELNKHINASSTDSGDPLPPDPTHPPKP